ncbi:tyrosine-type recombinase/integrase [Hyphococcus luteus]|uniref:Core-binding (CB) domain-containing protein n=1 Tax=Hyphococcus luteus TaxID=2058213 RepID=A0A2S7K3S7_9PROT|nr:integrase arm-type DNA-binding domain-containing protein [Marinicaulis flavus]PQA87160.1 hypothetical protein CW354_14065 [Marinicaulis flavus]
MSRAPRLLTDAVARGASPRNREYAISDTKLKGFALRVLPSGAKAWIVRMKTGGKHRRLTIATFPETDADAARARAHQTMARAGAGSAIAFKESDKPVITFRALADHYIKAKTPDWKPSTKSKTLEYLRAQLLPAFGASPATRITTAEVAEWFFDYSSRRAGGANKALGSFRAIMKFGRDNGYLPRKAPDPSHPIRYNVRPSRGRLLNADQLAKVGAFLDNPPQRWRDAADAIRLIILTGCRSGERNRSCRVRFFFQNFAKEQSSVYQAPYQRFITLG